MSDTIATEMALAAAKSPPVEAAAFRLSAGRKGLYAIGDMADGMTNVALGTFLLFYLTEVIGLPGSLAGLAVALALVVDAVADPLIGYITDNTRSRWGRRHPYMVGAAIPFGLAFALLFSVPKLGATGALFAYVFAILLMLRVSFSAFILPYAALGAELTKDYTDRSVLMTFRTFFNICANVTCVVMGFGLFMGGENGLLTRSAYVPFGWTGGAIITIAGLVSAAATFGVRGQLHQIAPASRSAAARLLGEIRDVFRNHSFLILFITILTFWVSQGTAISLAIHNYRYFWGIPAAGIEPIVLAGTVGLACGIPVCALLLPRMEKKNISALGLGVICVCQALPPILKLAGHAPAGAALQIMLGGFVAISSCALTCVGISFGSMMIDATDEHDLLFGVRREGLYFAALTFSGKAAIGVGTLVAGVALDLIGFPKDLAAHPHEVIAPATIRAIGLMAGPGAALISLSSVLVMTRYRLTQKRLIGVQSELSARN